MTSKVAQPTLNNFNGKVSQSPPGQSKVRIFTDTQGVPASYNGRTQPSSAERAQQFDAAMANQKGVKLADASLNLKIVGNKVYDGNTNEFIREIGPSNTPAIIPSVRNSALKGSKKAGSPTLNRLEPSHQVGTRTTFQPAAEVEPNPALSIAPGSALERRLDKLNQALESIQNEIQDLKGVQGE